MLCLAACKANYYYWINVKMKSRIASEKPNNSHIYCDTPNLSIEPKMMIMSNKKYIFDKN